MRMKKRLLIMSLAMALLLAGCGGGPSAVEGAEPSAAPEVTAPDTQDTQTPQESQETKPDVTPEILSWDKSMQMVNANTILAKSNDNGCAVLNSDGTVRAWLSDYHTVTPVNPFCFKGMSSNGTNLFDLNGNVIVEDIRDVWSKPQGDDDPWGIIQYTLVEHQDFGEKTTTYLMRTDSFENILELTTDPTNVQLYYDGSKYLMSTSTPGSSEIVWSTLDGDAAEPYQNPADAAQYIDVSIVDCAPYIYRLDDRGARYLHRESAVEGKFKVSSPKLLKYSEDIYEGNTSVMFGLMDWSGNKITDIKYQWCEIMNCGVLVTTPERKTDVYDVNGGFCFSSDSSIGFLDNELSHFACLETYVNGQKQFGLYDFEKKDFVLTADGSVSVSDINEKYFKPNGITNNKVTALYVHSTAGLTTLLCEDGTVIEDVEITLPAYSACGRLLVQVAKEPDKLMVINLANGEIESEFQAHLT